MKQIKTKLLKTIWNNIHRAERLITVRFTGKSGNHCALGCTFGTKGFDDDKELLIAERVEQLGWYSLDIVNANDGFKGSGEERRIHMLKFIGKELTSRGVEIEAAKEAVR